VCKLEKHFQGLEILHVLSDSNVAAEVLAKLGSDRAKVPPGVFVEELSAPSIKQPDEITPELSAPVNQVLVIAPSWTQIFIDYIKENKLPADKEDHSKKKELCPSGGQTLQTGCIIWSTTQMHHSR
jgi:hypothetical protein